MATQAHTTSANADAIHPETLGLLARIFPKWGGEASEPALPVPTPTRPAPAAAEMAVA